MPTYGSNGNYSASDQDYAVSDTDQTLSQIPIVSWLTGAKGRVDAEHAAASANANRGYWNNLAPPTADDLMGGQEGQDAQSAALQQLQAWGSGGLTGTDRAGLESIRGRDAQASGAQQRALMQQAQARGVGGGGLDYATRQQASQAGQQQASDAEAQMLQGAQQRALQATQAQGQLGGQVRQQNAQAVQGAYEGQTQRAAGATGQYGTDVGNRFNQSQSDQNRQAGLISGLLSDLDI